MNSKPSNALEVFEAGLRAAETAGLDATVTREPITRLRLLAGEAENIFEFWFEIDNEIGRADSDNLAHELIKLRASFEDELFKSTLKDVGVQFEQSAERGWQSFVNVLAEAVMRFRHGFAGQLLEANLPFSESQRAAGLELRGAVRFMSQARWPEAYEQLGRLAQFDFLQPLVRARLAVMLAQIELFHFRNAVQAKKFYDQAEQLAPNDGKVLSAVGEYWLTEKDAEQVDQTDYERALSYYERARAASPNVALPYAYMGEYFETVKKDLAAAQVWYQRAIDAAPGDGFGYVKLLKLFGKPELFKSHEPDLTRLLKQIIAVGPEDEYQTYTDYGSAYEQNLQFETASEWYEKAITLDPDRPLGYVAIAQLREKENRIDDARMVYRRLLEICPDSYEGYLGLAWLAEREEKWDEALDWYQRTPRTVKELSGLFQARVGEMQARLKNYAAAERIEKELLRVDPRNETAKAVLHTIVDDYYKELNDRAAAMRLLDEMHQIIGAGYLSDYHNRVGNLDYFLGEYHSASQHYRKAVAAKSGNAVFHRNLALALKEISQYEEAARELNTALELDSDKSAFDSEMALLINAQANDYYAAGDYEKAVELYDKAIVHDSNNDIIFSNLAAAWENVPSATPAEKLNQAIRAYTKAEEIKPAKKHSRKLAIAQSKQEIVLRYGDRAIDWQFMVTPIVVEVASDVVPLIEGDAAAGLAEDLTASLNAMKTRIQHTYGAKIPGVLFRANEGDLPEGSYVLMLGEVPLVLRNLIVGERFTPASAEFLASLNVLGTEGANPLTGQPGSWIKQDDWAKVEDAGAELWSPTDYLIRDLEALIERNLIDFVGHQEVAELVGNEIPGGLDSLADRPGKLTALTTVCRALLSERAPISPFREIYDLFEQLHSAGVGLQDIVEKVRSLPSIRERLPGNRPGYPLFETGPAFEAEIRNSVYRSDHHALLAMEPEPCQALLVAVRDTVANRRAALVVNSTELRPFVRLLVEIEFPQLHVLSRAELQSNVEFEQLGIIDLHDQTATPPREFAVKAETDQMDPNGFSYLSESISAHPKITVFLNDAVLNRLASIAPKTMDETVSMMRDGLFYELGILVPDLRIEPDQTLASNQFRFQINDRALSPSEGLNPDEFFVNETVERLESFKIKGTSKTNPANGLQWAVVKNQHGELEMCQKAGLTTWEPMAFMILALSAEIRRSAASFQTFAVTRHAINNLQAAFPDLVDTTLSRFTLEQISQLMRNLLDEGISVRDLRGIFENLLAITGTTLADHDRLIVFSPQAQIIFPVRSSRRVADLTMPECADAVRTFMKRYISHKLTRGAASLMVFLVDRDLEARLANLAKPLTDDEKASFLDSLRTEMDGLAKAVTPVVLTSITIRRRVRDLLRDTFPNLPVVSYQELSPETSIQPLARLSWTESPSTISSAIH